MKIGLLAVALLIAGTVTVEAGCFGCARSVAVVEQVGCSGTRVAVFRRAPIRTWLANRRAARAARWANCGGYTVGCSGTVAAPASCSGR